MKKSELKQLIKEVIEEVKIDWNKFNVDDGGNFVEVNGKKYSYHAKVTHSDDRDESSAYVQDIIVLDEDGNEVTDPDVIEKMERDAVETYIDSDEGPYSGGEIDDRRPWQGPTGRGHDPYFM